LVASCRATITITRALSNAAPPLPADLEARLRKRCAG